MLGIDGTCPAGHPEGKCHQQRVVTVLENYKKLAPKHSIENLFYLIS